LISTDHVANLGAELFSKNVLDLTSKIPENPRKKESKE
jgi:hypothetical protein